MNNIISFAVLLGEQIKVANILLGNSFTFACEFNDTYTESVVTLQKDGNDIFRIDTETQNQTHIDKRTKLFSGSSNVLYIMLSNIDRGDNALFQCLRKRANETGIAAKTKYNLTVLGILISYYVYKRRWTYIYNLYKLSRKTPIILLLLPEV